MIKPNEIYVFKLASGEELIVKVLNVSDTFYTISNPVSVAPNQRGIGLVPSLFTADMDGEIQLNTSSIVISALPAEDIRVKYIEATTGLTVPTEKKVILG